MLYNITLQKAAKQAKVANMKENGHRNFFSWKAFFIMSCFTVIVVESQVKSSTHFFIAVLVKNPLWIFKPLS